METSRHELPYERYGITNARYSPPRYAHRTQQQRNPLITPTSPPGPSTLKRDRILVVVTLDAERYTPVDVTDSLHDGPTIRARICNKLGVLDPAEQAQSLIYETEIGSDAWGHSLNDDTLSSMCQERADTKGSLAFIVERPGSHRRIPRRGRNSPLSPDYQSSDIESTTSDHSHAGAPQVQPQNQTTRRRNRSHTVDSRTAPQPPLTSDTSNSNPQTNGIRSPPPQRPGQLRELSNSTSPITSGSHTTPLLVSVNGIHSPHTHALPPTPDEQPTPTSSSTTSSQSQSQHTPNHLPSPPELSPQQSSQPRQQRRPVRPLPAIPTPTSSVPGSGSPFPLSSGAEHYPRSISMNSVMSTGSVNSTTSTAGGSTHSTSPNHDIEDLYA